MPGWPRRWRCSTRPATSSAPPPTVFHEGVPGHHLQIGAVRLAGDRLSRFARFTTVQAISDKLGERAWLAAREEARRRPGFDLKRWHTAALDLGPVGLDGLADTLRRIG